MRQAYKAAMLEMGGEVGEPDLAPLIVKLEQEGVRDVELLRRIKEFFAAYDETKSCQINRLNRKTLDLHAK